MAKLKDMNVREQMAAVSAWLAWYPEDISFGLKSMNDAVKLFRAAEVAPVDNAMDDPVWIKRVLGYCPFARALRLSEG